MVRADDATARKRNSMNSLKGSLLIAAPSLADPNFCRTVVLILEHTEDGAFGVVLNRPGSIKVSELLASISEKSCECDSRAFVGGPVQRSSVLVLHGFDDLSERSQEVISGVYLGSELALLEDILSRSLSGELGASSSVELPTGNGGPPGLEGEDGKRFRLFCGYAGWGAGQLDREMTAGGWLTVPAKLQHVFDIPTEKLWSEALSCVGGPYKFFAMMPPDPEQN